MKTVAILLVAVLIVAEPAGAADLSSRVEAVTVYPSGALVTRVARVELAAGDNTLRLDGLPPGLASELLQAEIDSTSAETVSIGQVRVSRLESRDAYDAAVAELTRDIDALKLRIRAIDDSSTAAERRLRFLDGLSQSYARDAGLESSRGAASVATLRDALDLLQTGSESASALIRENATAKAELARDLSVLERRLADLRGGSRSATAVTLTVTAERPVTTELRLRYYRDAAGWSPVYEARLDTSSGALTLLQQADVRQATAEAWQGVALTLSTSQPSGRLEAPELASHFLTLAERAREQSARASVSADAMLEVQALADESEALAVTAARRTDTNFAVNYEVPGVTDVPNDGGEATTLDVERFRFDTELITRVVPRSSTDAFLIARFEQTGSVPLYGSGMRIFVDGVYAGMAEMPTAMPGAEVELPMGQDRRVLVRAESQGGEGGAGGFFSRSQADVVDYVFEIANRRDSVARVEVLDRIPVSRDRSIDVEIGDDATPPDHTDLDDRPGLRRWDRSLAAGETLRIRHQYSIRYPDDRQLVRSAGD